MNLAIIGGGLSGTLLAHYLLREDQYPLTIYLFERDSQQLSRGIAYRQSTEGQLLNVPAGRMSIYGSEEGFYKWLCKTIDPTISPDEFVTRELFGTYLKEVFQQSLDQARQVTVNVISDEVIDVIKQGETLDVITVGKKVYRVAYAVVANGILPPQNPTAITSAVKQSGLYQANPWSFGYQNDIRYGDHVVLIGAGLTMLDHAVSLLRSNKALKISAFSRRGLLPRAHAPYEPYDFPEFNIGPTEDIGELLRAIRSYYKNHYPKGLDWRALIDKIRENAPRLWKALSSQSKARFLRHLKPYWEIHRHRTLGSVFQFIDQAIREGKFALLKGRLQEVQAGPGGLKIVIVNSIETVELHANYLLNSSGLQQNISLTSDTLLKNLMERGYMIPDTNGLGVETDNNGALRVESGKKNIFTLGALRRASEFECTAAKEIGEQAYALSNTLLILMR